MERVRLRIHLATCEACSRVEGQLRLLRRATFGLPEQRDDGKPSKT
jgi:hypothetical protein